MRKILVFLLTCALISCLALTSFALPRDGALTESDKWLGLRGAGSYGTYDGGEVTLKCDDNGYLWEWAAAPLASVSSEGAGTIKTLEEGTVKAELSMINNVGMGVFFGATGMENCGDNGSLAGNVSIKNAPNLQFYCLEIKGTDCNLKVDAAAGGGTSCATVISCDLTKIISGFAISDTTETDVSVEITYTKTGEITAKVNGVTAITVANGTATEHGSSTTAALDGTLFGGQYGIMNSQYNTSSLSAQIGKTGKVVVAHVKTLTASAPSTAPDTGDASALYAVVSALALVAAFAAVSCIKRKTIVE